MLGGSGENVPSQDAYMPQAAWTKLARAMQPEKKSERPPKKRYIIAYGELTMTAQSEQTMSMNMEKLGATEVLSKLWLLETDMGMDGLRRRVFETVLKKRGQVMLAEIGSAFETQHLPGVVRAFPPPSPDTQHRP